MIRSIISRHSVASLAIVLALIPAACGGGGASSAPPAAPSPSPPSTSVSEGARTSPSSASELKKPGEAKLGDKTKCPVSGEEFVVSENSPKVEYQGKTYYFCCSGCDKRFRADPKKYLPQ